MKGAVAGLAGSIPVFSSTAVWACPQCRPFVDAGIYNEGFAGTLLVVLLPIAVLTAMGLGIYFAETLADALKAKLRKAGGK